MALSQTNKQNEDGAIYVNTQDKDGVGISSTDVGGKQSLDVNVTNPISVDLDSATDSIEVLQATHDNLNANANIQVGDADVSDSNPVPISDAGGSITVDGSVIVSATDLDIRDLDSATDSVTVTGAVTVSATDLDIRDLSSATDSVSAVVTSSALPTGAATESTLAAISGKLSPASSALSQVDAAAASTTTFSILASSSGRKGFIIYNNSNQALLVAFAATASAAAFSVKLNQNASYENATGVYTGDISGIFPIAATGSVQITSLS